jgi:two-component system cell cycle sensor histidine kinase/response regulator CckA
MPKKPSYEEMEKRIREFKQESSNSKRVEDVLRVSEERYRTILDSIEEAYFEVDLKGNYKFFSDSLCVILGYSRDELMGKNNRNYMPPRTAREIFEIFNQIYKTGKPIRKHGYEIIKKDGTHAFHELAASLIRDENCKPIGFRGIAHDITDRKRSEVALQQAHDELEHHVAMRTEELTRANKELRSEITDRKQAEEALRESEEKYRHLIEKLDDIIWTVDINLNITYVSPSIKKNLGFTPKERMVQDPVDQMTPSSYQNIAELLIKELNREKEPGVNPNRSVRVEIEYYHKNGSTLWFENIISGLRDSNGILCGFHGVARDVSERKFAEKEKIKAQEIAGEQKKLALVGQVAGKMAHDFNNILGIIMGNTELSLMDCKDAETKKTLELILKQTLRGKNLTRNLVAFAKDQEPKQEFFRISEKIDLVLNLIKKDLQGIELIKEDKTGVPDLLADPGMIEHAFVNLIQNSIHAVSLVEHPRIICRSYSLDENICVEIEDNGCGIPKNHLENIFEPSFTLKGTKDTTGSYENGIRGTGYGMSNVKKYIEQHKGNISVDSEIGSGTKFTISIPAIKKNLTSEEIIEIRKEITHFEKYILLVEDETAISNVQYRILTNEPCNHKVDIANTGQIAMDLFDRTEYDFISLDYILPGGINGMDVYHHIRETNKTIPILFISGNIEFLESIKDLKQKDGNIDHLSKPCQNKDYVNSINGLLERTLVIQE